MLATLALEAVQRPGLAVRDQVGRLSRPGRRRRRQGPALDPQPQGRRDLLPAAAHAADLDRGPRGDRRRRGRRPRRRRAARLLAAPGAARREGRRRGSSTRRSTCSTSMAGRCSTSPLEDRKRLLKSVLAAAPARPLRGPRRGRGAGVLRGGARRRASRASSPSSGARATSPAGAPTPGSSSRSGPSRSSSSAAGRRGRGTRATSGRSRSASTRTASCGSAARSGRGSPARPARPCCERLAPLAIDDPPFDPPPPQDYRGRWGGDLGDITWVRPELVIRAELGGWSRDGMVRQAAFKGIEAGRDPTDRRARDRGRHDDGGPCRRGGGAARCRRRPIDADAEAEARGRRRSPKPAATGRRAPRRPTSPPTWRVTDDELAALDALGKEGVWRVGADELKLTNLDKPLFEPRRASPGAADAAPITKRELIRYFARIAPTMLPPPRGPAAQPPALPERRRRARLLAEGHPRDRAEVADPLARDRRRRPRRTAAPTTTSSPTAPRRCAGSATRRASRSTPGPAASRTPGDPPSPTSTSTPGRRRPGTRRSSWPGSTGPRSATSASAAIPRRPASAASRSGSRSCPKYELRRHERLGRAGLARRRRRPCPDLVSWEWAKEARKGRARLDYTQNASIKTLVAPYAVRPAAGAPGLRADHLGRAGRPGPAPRPLDDPDHRRAGRRASATCSPPAQTDAQELPKV